MEIRPEDEDDKGDDKDVPETPPDEPRPPRVDDPPPPDSKGPYVVHAHSEQNREAAVNTGERKERRGFASMSPEKQREIASKGGRGGRGRLIVPPADGQPATTGPTNGDATPSER